tara:strand:+ start:168 stop:458 length:291 start_codon:yes stop_codon:yes gene_type:complete
VESFQYDLYGEKQNGEYEFRKRNVKKENSPKPYLDNLYKNRRFFIDTFKSYNDLKTFAINSSTNSVRIIPSDKNYSLPKLEMEEDYLESYMTNFFI